MTLMTRLAHRRGHMAVTLAVAGALLATGANVAAGAGGPHSLEGTWAVEVTLRDCATNQPIGTSNTLQTFHRGGTLSESPGAPTAFAVGQRGDAHGIWRHRNGRLYSQKMVALIDFDTPPNLPSLPGFDPGLTITPGFFAGWQTVTHTLELVDANHFRSGGTSAFYNMNRERYRSGCSTATGERFR